MSLPIRETPILHGEDARKFAENAEMAPERPIPREDYDRAVQTYNAVQSTRKKRGRPRREHAVKTLNIEIPANMYQRVREIAAEKKYSMTKLIQSILIVYFDTINTQHGSTTRI